MAWNQEHKEKTRKKILTVAGELFSRDGFENTGIDDVMKTAGMTRGAFYHHFDSKSDLYSQAMQQAARFRLRGALVDSACDESPLDMDKLVAGYLSQAHIEGENGGCPMAFLVSDMAQRDDTVRSTYTLLLQGLIGRIRAVSTLSEEQILQHVVLMIGGVAIARAVNDPELQQALLDACRVAVTTPSTTAK